jgi:hypothetical protein
MYESWDFQEQIVKQQVWRMYFAKLMNLSVVVIINAEFIAAKMWFRSTPLFLFNSDKNTKYDCRED